MRPRFDPTLLYARVWEDDLVLREGLRIRPGDRVFSVASAGENGFSLLLDDPSEVVLLDRNATQMALVRLKVAALRHLEPREGRRLFGFDEAPRGERRRLYRSLRSALSSHDRERFDAAEDVVSAGLLHAGKFERYLATFRNFVLPLVQSRATVDAMTGLRDLEAQRRLYRERWDSRRWRALFRVFFGRRVMQRMGRERAFFDHVTATSIGDVFRARAQKALCDMPVADNPYLLWILTGRSIAPAWLDEATAPLIRRRLERLTLVEADLLEYLKRPAAGRRFDAHNLSDVFEYMPEDAASDALRVLHAASEPGARLVYWNLLVPRDAHALPELYEADTGLASALHAHDRAFFYGRLVIERTRATL
ncbi:MAG: DUF3419 family protein [Myxococcales bacterium]|nr:DUF3419 family protein [Myxococcales bacterium]